jgi:hypothetical protein
MDAQSNALATKAAKNLAGRGRSARENIWRWGGGSIVGAGALSQRLMLMVIIIASPLSQRPCGRPPSIAKAWLCSSTVVAG